MGGRGDFRRRLNSHSPEGKRWEAVGSDMEVLVRTPFDQCPWCEACRFTRRVAYTSLETEDDEIGFADRCSNCRLLVQRLFVELSDLERVADVSPSYDVVGPKTIDPITTSHQGTLVSKLQQFDTYEHG